jgi:hypothetical protein
LEVLGLLIHGIAKKSGNCTDFILNRRKALSKVESAGNAADFYIPFCASR